MFQISCPFSQILLLHDRRISYRLIDAVSFNVHHLQDEECFYQCEPMLGYFQIGTTGYIQNVPVCADYCDSWFEACQDDLTCVEDWLADFDYAVDGNNSCPVNSSCITFREMYRNGEGLCNRMWGHAFYYSTNTNNCTVMKFNNSLPNPNLRLSFPSEGVSTAVHVATLIILLLVAVNIKIY